MARKDKKQEQRAETVQTARRYGLFACGVALIVAGIWLVMWSQRIRPGGVDWIWWAGIVVAAVGGHGCLFSGMSRAQAVEWLKSEAVALGVALMIRWPIAEPYRIPSGSMEPTLHGDDRFGRGDRVFVNKWIYGVRYPFMNKRIWYGAAPQRWDIVVFKAVRKDAVHKTLVKRIVGMPGERIQIRDGKVYANDVPLELPATIPQDVFYTSSPSPFSGMMYGVRPEDEYSVVPEGHYLVLGDNSANSADGRHFGWLPNENIVGRVACIWWPPTRWRDFTGFSKTLWWRTLVGLTLLWLIVRLFLGRSWGARNPEGRGVNHYFIAFWPLGLRVPFTRWWLWRWARVQRGDLVIYHPQGERAREVGQLMGRIAGLPGEKVTITDGCIHIDGTPLEQPAALAAAHFASEDPDAVYGRSRNRNHCVIPADHYFILSDAPQDPDAHEALDSRILGWVAEQDIAGVAVALWWPPRRARRLA